MVSNEPELRFPKSGMVVSHFRKAGSELWKCGSQSPDRWLKVSRNTQTDMKNFLFHTSSPISYS